MGYKKFLFAAISLMVVVMAFNLPGYSAQPITPENDITTGAIDAALINESINYDDTIYAESGNDDSIKLHAAGEGNTVTYSITKGDTYSFANIADASYNISGLSGYIDYVIYNADGSIAAYEGNVIKSSLAVPAGGIVIITFVSKDVSISLVDSQFTAEKKDDPVMERRVMITGDGYVFENISDNAYSLCTGGYKFDYVLYDATGNIVEYDIDAILTNKSISAGYKIKIVTNASDKEVTVAVLYDKFIVEDAVTPAFKRINTYPGESYIIKNTGSREYVVKEINTSYYNGVMYDAAGNITEYGLGRTYKNVSNSIPAGYSLKITQTADYMTVSNGIRRFAVLYDEFSVEKSDSPVMNRINMYPGETYTIKNTGNTSYSIQHYAGLGFYFDYILYDAEGKISDYGFGGGDYDNPIPAGYSMKITLLSVRSSRNMLGLNALNGKFTVKKEDTPVASRMSIYRGETYTITNISDEAYLLDGLPITADYIIYDAEGNIAEYGIEASMAEKNLPAGYSMNFSYINKKNVEIKVLNEKCTISQCDTQPMVRVYAQNGEKYKFTNISSEARSINFGYQNYEIYDAAGNMKDSGTGYLSNVEIPGGGYIIVWTGNNTQYFAAVSEWFTAEAVTPVYNYLDYTYGQSYKFENTSSNDKEIALTGYQSWDYVVFDADGVMTSYDLNYTSGGSYASDKITLSAGATAYVTLFSSYYNPIIIDEGIAVTPYDKAVDIDKLCPAKQVYKLTNTDTRTHGVEADTESADYIIYNSDGSIKEYENNAYKYHLSDYSADYAYEVPAGGWLLISSESAMRLSGLNEYFEIEELDGELYTTTHIEDGKTFSFRNTSLSDSVVRINSKYSDNSSSVYDYVIYNADGSVHSEAVFSSSDITVPVKCTLVITACVGSPVIKTLTDMFDISERSYPVFKKADVGIASATTFTNTTNTDKALYLLSGGYVDYITYNSAGDAVKSAETVNISSVTIPANGSVQVRALLNNFSAAGLYESFSEEDVSVQPTEITLSESDLTMEIGDQKVLKATVAPDNATNKNVVWASSDTNIVTVTQTGKISAKAAGSAIITVTTEDGGKSASCNVTVTTDSVSIVTGDVNGDGTIDFTDAIAILKHDAGVSALSGDKLTAADANGDAAVDFVDAILILKYDSGLISSFK